MVFQYSQQTNYVEKFTNRGFCLFKNLLNSLPLITIRKAFYILQYLPTALTEMHINVATMPAISINFIFNTKKKISNTCPKRKAKM